MRLHFELTPSQEPVPFDYQHFLTGAFHKWLGDNELHDGISLYSLSWLSGGHAENGHLAFPHGARWFVTAHDDAVIRALENGALREPEVCCGMSVVRMKEQNAPEFGGYYAFKVGSPVLARSKEIEGKVKHYLYSDPEADSILTAALRHKMDKAGMKDECKHVAVRFDRSYAKARSKLVTINNISNRASICPVIIEGTPEAVQFAWNVGAGHLTGSGFGCLL